MLGLSQRKRTHRGHALILNYTATSYHWGCYATSVALHDSLTEAGFAVLSAPVEATHAITTTPNSAEELRADEFQRAFEAANGPICQQMRDVDLVVINGEGTLHRGHAGPRNLLALAYIAATRYGRTVHMVNHSCFPNGDDETTTPDLEALYRLALGACTTRVAREPLTAARYARWGLTVEQGFDCLPVWVDSYLPRLQHKPRADRRILIAGGVSWYEAVSEAFAAALLGLGAGASLSFLGGAYRREPPEDARTMNALKPLMPALNYLAPASTDDWLREIASASLLVTGRFHHAVAAAALGTPFVSIASNTPKTDGVCQLLALPPPLNPYAESFRDDAAAAINAALSSSGHATTRDQQRLILSLSRRNFTWKV